MTRQIEDYIGNIIDLYSDFPLVKLGLVNKDPEITEYYEKFREEIGRSIRDDMLGVHSPHSVGTVSDYGLPSDADHEDV